MMTKRLHSSRGFTIVELLIALSVLSVILVIASALMIRIGSIYTKGVNAANLQNTARNVMGDVTSNLQFSGDDPSNCPDGSGGGPNNDIGTTCYTETINSSLDGHYPIYSYCIGTTRYSYVLNRESGTDSNNGQNTNHVLWRDTMSSSGTCHPLDISKSDPTQITDSVSVANSGADMVPVHMKLGRFKIKPVQPISSGIYNVDVWMAYGDSDLAITDPSTGATKCSGQSGTEFCSLANISTTIVRRVN